jgi:hypothetical protein
MTNKAAETNSLFLSTDKAVVIEQMRKDPMQFMATYFPQVDVYTDHRGDLQIHRPIRKPKHDE